jgi:hypothetical protein
MLIDPDAIYMKNEDDYQKSDYEDSGSYDEEYSETYNEYITEFIVETPTGEQYSIGTEDSDEMYITNELNDIIRRKAMPVDGKISIPMQYLVDMPILLVIIHNNELSKAMERIMNIIDKNAVTKSMDRHQLLQTYIEAIIEGNLNTSGVHCEVILSNQLRDAENILESPDWSVYDAPYQILTLNGALTNHPSVVVSLMYQRLSKTLYTPLTFRKNKPSFLDLFFMVKPQDYLYNTEHIVAGRATEDDAPKIINPFIHIEEEADDSN